MPINERSKQLLLGVHPDLVAVVTLAFDKSPVKYVVTEGVRSLEKQKAMVAKGASKTMKSRHIPESNACRLACAVDLAAWLDGDFDGSVDNGEIRWDGGLYFDIAYAVQKAARELGIDVVWGGCWESLLTADSLEDAQAAYVARKRKEGGRPLIDGPHFELNWKAYP